MTTATSSICDLPTVKDLEYQTRTGAHGIARNTSIRSHRLQEVTSGITDPTLLSSGSSIGFMEALKVSSSRDGLLILAYVCGAESLSCHSHSTLSVAASVSASMIAMPTITSTSAIE